MVNLKPLVGDAKKPEPFGVFDAESMNWIDFLMMGVYDGEIFDYFTDLSDFLDYLRDHPTVSLWYAHFGGKFDFMFALQEAVLRRSDIQIDGMIPRGSGLLCMTLHFFDQTTRRKISSCKLYDSSAMLPFGLAMLTQSFGVENKKGEWDHSKTTGVTKELVEYNEDDCRGLYQVIERYRQWPLIQKAGVSSTMAGQAVKVFRTFMTQTIYSLPDDVDVFVRKSYFGGRTEIFKPLFIGDEKNLLHCYDVNSLYPFIMRECEFPVKFDRWTTDYMPQRIGFYEAIAEVPKNMKIPPLPVVAEVDGTPKLIFPTGRFRGFFSTAEMNYAMSLGVKFPWIGNGALFVNGGKIFKGYIETLYEMRLEAQKRGDGVTDVLTKLLMNSTYGRFGLNRERENLVFDEGQAGVFFHCEMKGKDKNGQEIYVRLMREPTVLEQSFSNVAVANWVTSNARIHMHKLYMEAPETMYYTDTDSIFTTKEFSSGSGLGALKHEYSCEQACFLLPKTYITSHCSKEFKAFDSKGKPIKTNKKVTMKGFDKKKIAHFDFEDFYTALEGEVRLKVTHDAKIATFKTAIQKNTFLTMLPQSEKQIRSMYDKRKVVKTPTGDWDSEALHYRL